MGWLLLRRTGGVYIVHTGRAHAALEGAPSQRQLLCGIRKRRACLNSNHDYHPPLIAIPISDLFRIRVSCQIGGY